MKHVLITSIALAACLPSIAVAQYNVQWAAPASNVGPMASFPMGTPLQLATRTELNTKDCHAGDRFYLEVAEPLMYRGQVVVPVGSIAVGEVMRSERNGHFGKRGQLDIRINYVETPSGPVRLSGRTGRHGYGQELLSIGGALLVSWPMIFIHGTSGRLPAETSVTAYLADDLRFNLQPISTQAVAAMPDSEGQTHRPLPANFDPSVFSSTGS
ncbi:hypothetical protein [Sphingomonas sp. PAMC 26621]|uniref:hypothetical protein n=1 Tax=Sphingomonas sp. PAMC 26621 TaxID=1112213 RepID=UPI0009DA864C|nr:hypothetical protein [Sphingomonas sp. PAMC 26621]